MAETGPVRLAFRQYSDSGPPLLVLHGLFGSQANWGWHNRRLASIHAVYGLDLRNHGDSPHSEVLDYPAMAADLKLLVAEQDLAACALLGHSMGGKVAMQLALDAPELVRRLVVVDIAPVDYPSQADGHDQIIAAMKNLDTAGLASRGEADVLLREFIAESSTRQFILTNLVRNRQGESGFRWRLNLDAIEKNYHTLRTGPAPGGAYEGPCLFIKGERSDYIMPEHEAAIREQFPSALIKVIPGSGHWVHAEKPQTLYKIVADFLSS